MARVRAAKRPAVAASAQPNRWRSLAWGVTLALLVASIKGSLVACYFMHLISEKKLIYAVLALTVAFFIVLLFLPILTVHDGYWMRG